MKHCHFFNNGKPCIYEDIGCMFLHEESDQCKFKNCINNLCPFKHNHLSEEPEIIDVEDTETENFTTEENQCHICRMKLQTKDLFYNHVEIEHVEYFKGMMEVLSRNSNTFQEAE